MSVVIVVVCVLALCVAAERAPFAGWLVGAALVLMGAVMTFSPEDPTGMDFGHELGPYFVIAAVPILLVAAFSAMRHRRPSAQRIRDAAARPEARAAEGRGP